MLKKTVIGAFVVVVFGSFILGRDTWSYLSTSVTSVRKAIKREVPLEFEIQRARNMVAQLDGEVRKCLHVIAEEEVNIDELKRDLDTQVAQHDLQKEQILVQRKDLELKKVSYSYGGKIYTASEVQSDLADRFGRYQTVEETLNSRRQILASRQTSLNAARKKLDAMLDAKERLLVDIENLDARLKTLEASQVASTIDVNDSAVSRTRELINEIGRKVAVQQKLADGASRATGLIEIETTPEVKQDLTAQIDQYFGGASSVESLTQTDTPLIVVPVSSEK
jgi:chromosome segregation ATPase